MNSSFMSGIPHYINVDKMVDNFFPSFDRIEQKQIDIHEDDYIELIKQDIETKKI